MKHVLFVQNGNFADAYRAFAQGHAETYRDQKRSVDFVTSLARETCVTTLAFGTDTADDELAPQLMAMSRTREGFDATAMAQFLDSTRPSHMVLRTPHRALLQQARKRRIHVLPVFADLFVKQGWRAAYNHLRLARALVRSGAPCVSNHSLNASRSLVSVLGLNPGKVVPWDWSAVPVHESPKTGVADPTCPTLFYAGVLSQDKGVGDCLEAVAALRSSGVDWRITLAGKGDQPYWEARAEQLGIGAAVTFLGMIANTQVRTLMRQHDFVVVPSRHSYPEGLPNTIYEALASRSVLVMSDHPSFMGRLTPERDCLVFPEKNVSALVGSLQKAANTPSLYAKLSQNSRAAHDGLYVGMEWTNLVRQFLDDPKDETGWVRANALSTLGR